MFLIMLQVFKSQVGRLTIALLLGLVGGGFLMHHFRSPTITTKMINGTKVVTVEKPILTTKVVDKVVSDPHDQQVIKWEMQQNAALKNKVTELTIANAALSSKGGTSEGGAVQPIPSTQTVGGLVVPSETGLTEYKDYQLDATYNSSSFNYTLNQSFKIVSSTGRTKDGSAFNDTKLYQETPTGAVNVPATTTAIFADQATPRWMVSPRIQAGVGINSDKTEGAVVTFQWLKYGKSTDPKDLRFAILSPGIFLNATVKDPGVLLFSYNLGSLPRQPFSNLWVSPFLSRSRFGIVISATF